MPERNKVGAGKEIPPLKGPRSVSPDTARARVEGIGPAQGRSSLGGIGASGGETESLSITRERYHLLQGVLQSTSDGILAVSLENEVLFANERFARMWRVPQEVMASKDDTALLQYVLDQLSDPQGFLRKVKELYLSSEESFDVLYFKDGRVFERLSRPMREGPEVRGRVWSFRDVTERRRAEEALLESERRFHSLYDTTTIGMYRTTPDGRVLLSNPAGLRMLGYDSLDELAKRNLEKDGFEPGYERSQFHERMKREGTIVGLESAWKRKDGSTIYVRENATAVKDNQGNILYYDGTFEDITERKQAEDALAASEAELRALFASMQDVVMAIDRDGTYRKIAPTDHGLLVRPPEELLGRNLNEVFPADEAEVFRGVMQSVLETKQHAQIEYKLVIAGQTVWFQTTISPLDEDSTLWVAHDISHRRQMEETVRNAEAKYRSLFENATIGIYQSAPNGSFLAANPVMARIFGYDSPEDMLRRIEDIEQQYYVEAADRHEFERLMMEQGEVREFISPHRRKDGGLIWTQENARAVKDARGDIVSYEGFVRDITGRKQAEEELRRAKEALEAANLELRQSLERERLLASTDGLTGLCNQRHFFELAAREFQAAARYQYSLALIMFDLDDFKQVNDTLGHTAGDKLLVRVAQTAAAQVRTSDLMARYGGDEFVVLLPHASAHQALPVAERIRASVAAIRLDALPGQRDPASITLSIGIAELRRKEADENVERMIQRADDALYQAKRSGRNRTVIADLDGTGAAG